MPGFEIGVLHHDHGRSCERQVIVRGFACDQNAVADLEILKLDGRGILQVLFAGSDAKNAGCWLQRDAEVGTRILGKRDRCAVDCLDGPDPPAGAAYDGTRQRLAALAVQNAIVKTRLAVAFIRLLARSYAH
jgi:hypothetical protein